MRKKFKILNLTRVRYKDAKLTGKVVKTANDLYQNGLLKKAFLEENDKHRLPKKY